MMWVLLVVCLVGCIAAQDVVDKRETLVFESHQNQDKPASKEPVGEKSETDNKDKDSGWRGWGNGGQFSDEEMQKHFKEMLRLRNLMQTAKNPEELEKYREQMQDLHFAFHGTQGGFGPRWGPMGGPWRGQMGGPMGGPWRGPMGGPMGGPWRGGMGGPMGGQWRGPMGGPMGGFGRGWGMGMGMGMGFPGRFRNFRDSGESNEKKKKDR